MEMQKETLMFRMTLTVCLAVVLAGGAMAEKEVVTDFTSSNTDQRVNILERWNPDGTYGWGMTASVNRFRNDGELIQTHTLDTTKPLTSPNLVLGSQDALNLAHLVSYASMGQNARFSKGPSGYVADSDDPTNYTNNYPGTGGDNRWIDITFHFGMDVKIDTLFVNLRGGGDSITNFQWLDSNGNILAQHGQVVPYLTVPDPTLYGTPGYYDPADRLRTSEKVVSNLETPVWTSSLTLRFYAEGYGFPTALTNANPDLATWAYNRPDLGTVGAYLASDQTLKIDGTYNIFWYENGKAIPTTSMASAASLAPMTDLNQLGGSTSLAGGGGWCTWELSQEYELHGMMLTATIGDTRQINDATILVSMDGEEWFEVWSDPAYRWFAGSETYMAFHATTPEAAEALANAKFVQLTWGDGTIANINQFQLFGAAIPEPATMTLLALGGLAMLRRRK